MDSIALLSGLAKLLGLPGLTLDARSACALRLPDGAQVDLHFLAEDGLVCLSTEVGIAITSEQTRLCESLLLVNLTMSGHGAGHFCLDGATGAVLACTSHRRAGLDPQGLLERLQRLVKFRHETRRHLSPFQWLVA